MNTRSNMMIAAAGVWLVLMAGAAHGQILSPGELSADHASIDGDKHCDSCHESGRRVAEKKCLECHDDLERRIKAGAGLHGRNYRGQDCGKCHVEHLGRKARLVRWPSRDRDKLDHALTGWVLKDSHAKTGCDRCHDKKNRRGAKTYLGLSTACASCHKDSHNGRFGKTCESCHSVKTWKDVAVETFDHDLARFRLQGKHKSVECKECHGQPPKYRGIGFDDCASCHKDPHKGRFKQKCSSCHNANDWQDSGDFRQKHPGLKLVRGHRQVSCKRCHDRGNLQRPSKGRACVSCHEPVHIAKFGRKCESCHASIQWVGLADKIGEKAHPKTRYPLRGQHQKASCDQCHLKNVPVAQRFRGLRFERCTDCHADRHNGEFQDRDSGECAACHTVSGFRPTTFGVEQHRTTRFVLDGRHQASPCGRCHTGARPRLDLRVAKSACADCHENPHGTQFEAELRQGGCARCHSPVGWEQANIDHSTWPLTGVHQSAKCSACHGTAARGAESKEAAMYRGVPRLCDGCHEDVHAGQFRLSEPVRSCEFCHTTEAFKIKGFAHETSAGYALTGKHQALACAKCHPTEQLRNNLTAVRYRLGYRACNDCHRNPHTK